MKCHSTGRVRYTRDLRTGFLAFVRHTAAERRALLEDYCRSESELYRSYGCERIADLEYNKGKSGDFLLPISLAEAIRANLIACGERLGGERGKLIADAARRGYSLIDLCCHIKTIRIRPIDRWRRVCCTADTIACVRAALLSLPVHDLDGYESSHGAMKVAARRRAKAVAAHAQEDSNPPC